MLKRILSLGFAALALAVIAPAIGSLTGVGEGVAQAQTPPAPEVPDAPDAPDCAGGSGPAGNSGPPGGS